MEGGRKSKEEVVMRKGPWMAEEDEILMDFVKKYGPRDWSSIRSKGLLPRTGKSCRLRWVNKLKPDLKTGCKFTAEEERVVIDLQARFGNKWARIATYLPGRTDNDVKNFWSTRQKRLARILQTPAQGSKSHKNNGKAPLVSNQQAALALEAPTSASMAPVEGESSTKRETCQHNFSGESEIKMIPLPNLVNSNLLNQKTSPSQLEFTPSEKQPCINQPPPPPAAAAAANEPEFPFPRLPQPTLNLPILPENQDLVPGLGDTTSLLDMFGNREACETENGSQFPVELPFFSMGGAGRNSRKGENGNLVTPDSFFDDFPMDMFDYIESLPSSSEW